MGSLVPGRQQGACNCVCALSPTKSTLIDRTGVFFGVSNWLIMSDHVKGYPLNVRVLKRNEQESEKDKF